MRRWFRHHVVEAMPGHVVGWAIGGAIVALSGVSPDDWVAHLVRATSEFLPQDWSANTSALALRSSFAGVGVAILGATLLLRRRTNEQPVAVPPTTPLPPAQAAATPALTLPDKPSIAVLPFQNLSGDSEQEYFCDGMVEDITTGLSRMKWLFVIARNSAFTYKGKTVDVKQVGRELGVRYILEGSVRKANNRVRITGQLIDASTGAHVWADRFEADLADLFDLQDRITSSVLGAIEPALTEAEIQRSATKPTDSLVAYDYYLRALAKFYEPSPARYEEALSLCTKATAADSNYAAAYALASYVRFSQIAVQSQGLDDSAKADIAKLARKAIDTGANDPTALFYAGHALCFYAGLTSSDQEFSRALNAIERSLALDPNCASAWAASGYAHWWTGKGDIAIEDLRHALRLSPRDPLLRTYKAGIAWAHFIEKRYIEAIEWSDAALSVEPAHTTSIRCKVASFALLGRLVEAKENATLLLSMQPMATIRMLRSSMPMRRPEDMARYLDGLRKAGVPE